MKQHTNRTARPRRTHAWGALAFGLAAWLAQPSLGAIALGSELGSASAAGSGSGPSPEPGAQERSLASRFQAWRLGVVTGVLTPAAREELSALAKEVELAASAEGATEAAQSLWTEVQAEQEAIKPKAAVAASGIAGRSGQSTLEDDVLKRSILASLKSSNLKFIQQLGARAVPSLRALAKATDGSPTPNGELDPLEVLFRVDLAAAMDTALELMSSKSFLVKRATVESVSSRIQYKNLFSPVGETDWAFKNPAWAGIATLAFEEPAVTVGAMRKILKELTRRGLLPRELADQATEAGGYSDVASPIPDAVLWFLERNVSHPSPEVRREVIRPILEAGIVQPVLPLANDPDGQVRLNMAADLLETTVGVYYDRTDAASSGSTRKRVYPPFDAPLFEAFKSLATSESEGDEIARAIWGDSYDRLSISEATKLSAEQLKALIPLAKTPYQLTSIAAHAKGVREGEQVAVVKAVISEFAKRKTKNEERHSFQSAMEGVILRGLTVAHGKSFWELALFLDEKTELKRSIGRSLWISARQLIEDGEISASPSPDWLHRFEDSRGWQIFRSRNRPDVWFDALSSADKGRTLKLYWEVCEAEGRSDAVTLTSSDELLSDPLVLRALLVDQSIFPAGRYWAARGLAETKEGRADSSLVEPIADTLVGLNMGGKANSLLYELSTRYEVMRAMLKHPEATDEFLLDIDVVPDEQTFDSLVKRFPIDTWAALGFQGQIWQCVRVLLSRADEGLNPIVETLCVSSSAYASRTAAFISKGRSEALFPLARKILQVSRSGSKAWNGAVDAIAGYFNADAAEALLEAAKGARNEESRQRVMSAVRQITEWREAAAAWEKGTGAAAKREAAIGELLITLDDPAAPLEARAASMRGLGLLGAVEELPRIIAALASDEAEMATAARAALARLEEE